MKVDAIVVEFGNARWQAVVDRYVGGEAVAHADVARAWRDFAGAGPSGFRAPIYEDFFATVRAVNATLPTNGRLRLLLGDPPRQRPPTELDDTIELARREALFPGWPSLLAR